MKFQSEAARLEAIQGIDELDPDAASKLAEYTNAEIGDDEPASGGEPEPSGEPSPEPPPEPEPKVELEPEPDPSTEVEHKIKDLKGFKTPEELLKSFDNSQEMIRRQAEKIKALESRPMDPGVAERLEKAERELAEMKSRGEGTKAKEASADIEKLERDRTAIVTILDELDRQAEEDPDVVYTAEYQKKYREALRLNAQNGEGYTSVLNQLSRDLAETKGQYTEYLEGQRSDKAEKVQKEMVSNLYTDMDSLDDPEFKTTRPSKQLAEEYLAWQRDVAIAFYGRPAKTEEEKIIAMDQLQLGNPKIIQECQLRDTPTKPTEEMARYLKKCELNLYRQGYRKNPATGRFSSERRVMVPDESGKMVPYIQPSLKEALIQMRAEEGHYEKQVDSAYQKGATDFAQAAGRRDMGAVTVDGGAGQGESKKTAEWAIRVLSNVDEIAIASAVNAGNTSVLAEINEARKILGRDPITF